MRRTLLTITAVVLFVAALAGWAWFLYHRTLQEADQWSSVAGIFVNTLLSAASLGTALWALRTGKPADQPLGTGAVRIGGNSSGQVSTQVTGPTPLGGSGAVSVGGDSTAPITTRVTDTTPEP